MPPGGALAEPDGGMRSGAPAEGGRGRGADAAVRLCGGRRQSRPGGRTKVAGGMVEMMRDGASESQDDMGSTTAPTLGPRGPTTSAERRSGLVARSRATRQTACGDPPRHHPRRALRRPCHGPRGPQARHRRRRRDRGRREHVGRRRGHRGDGPPAARRRPHGPRDARRRRRRGDAPDRRRGARDERRRPHVVRRADAGPRRDRRRRRAATCSRTRASTRSSARSTPRRPATARSIPAWPARSSPGRPAPTRSRRSATANARCSALIADGIPSKTIARRLGITEPTVRAHLTRIYRHIGVDDRTQAALWAVEHGMGRR